MKREVRSAYALMLTAAALITATLVAQAPPSSQDRPVFRAGADVVSVDASVQRDKRPVIGLRAPDFELLDNGAPQ